MVFFAFAPLFFDPVDIFEFFLVKLVRSRLGPAKESDSLFFTCRPRQGAHQVAVSADEFLGERNFATFERRGLVVVTLHPSKRSVRVFSVEGSSFVCLEDKVLVDLDKCFGVRKVLPVDPLVVRVREILPSEEVLEPIRIVVRRIRASCLGVDADAADVLDTFEEGDVRRDRRVGFGAGDLFFLVYFLFSGQVGL